MGQHMVNSYSIQWNQVPLPTPNLALITEKEGDIYYLMLFPKATVLQVSLGLNFESIKYNMRICLVVDDTNAYRKTSNETRGY